MSQIGKIFNFYTRVEKSYVMRDLDKRDIGQILELQHGVLSASGFDLQWFYPFAEEELKEIVEGGSSLAVGVYIDGKLIAFRTGSFSGIEYDEITNVLGERYKAIPCFLMNGVFVDEAYRGNHLQQKLSEHCIRRCRKKGIRTFLSVAHPDNISSIKSIKNLGFEEKERRMLFDGKYERLIFVKEMN